MPSALAMAMVEALGFHFPCASAPTEFASLYRRQLAWLNLGYDGLLHQMASSQGATRMALARFYSTNSSMARRLAALLRGAKFRWELWRHKLLKPPMLSGNETGLFSLPEVEAVGPEDLPGKYDDSIICTKFFRRPLGSPRSVLSVSGDHSFFCSHFLVRHGRDFIYDLGIDNRHLLNHHNVKMLVNGYRGEGITRLKGTVCYVSNTAVDNYFHWMILALPMIHYCRLAGHRVDHVYVNREILPAFVLESLERCGIAASAIVTAPCSGDLNVMTINDWRYAVRPESYAFVRDLYAHALSDNPARPRRIFVDRGTAPKNRYLRNSGKVAAMLKRRYSVMRITMDDLTIADQANIFHNADVVIAPHGAALTNLIFCRPGTKVVELFSPNYLRDEYSDLARATGLRHVPVIGEVEDHLRLRPKKMSPEERAMAHGTDYTVQLDKLAAVIDSDYDQANISDALLINP
jgi:capsular polysaccharide biosynthesis protein